MAHRFAAIAFTDSVREMQEALGSRAGYAALDGGEDTHRVLGASEAAFIAGRDSFYMATVSETGWPYVQHRGGPAGFVRVLDERTIGFADFAGNRQYVSVGNLRRDDRVSLFFMDYPNRTRLKLLGRVRLVELDEAELLGALESPGYRAPIERGFVIEVEAFDWNCPQHITPRYTRAEIDALAAPAVEQNRALGGAADGIVGSGSSSTVPGGGSLELVVAGMRQLTPRVRAYELRAVDGADLPAATPGSHLEVPVALAGGQAVARHYSIASGPARRDAYEIAVLRHDDGRGGSEAVHDSFALGMRLRVEPPRNHFCLHTDTRPAVLVAGGIGITPIRAMAHALLARGERPVVHYAGREVREMAYLGELRELLGEGLVEHRSVDGVRLDVERALRAGAPDALFYVCGPVSLIDSVVETAARVGIDPQRVRYERFDAPVDADAEPVEVRLRRSGVTLDVPAGTSILDAMLEAGVAAPHSCRAGLCKSCAVRVLDGEPMHRDGVLSADERERQDLMLPCVSRAVGGQLELDA